MLRWLSSFFETLGDFSAFAVRATWKGVRHPIRAVELLEQFYFIGWQSWSLCYFLLHWRELA